MSDEVKQANNQEESLLPHEKGKVGIRDAFPQVDQVYLSSIHGRFFPSLIAGTSFGGCTKREYFAALAMAGLMDPTNPNQMDGTLGINDIAAWAVNQADALLLALRNISPP